jgi:uncharacterized protein (TIGR00251 family)
MAGVSTRLRLRVSPGARSNAVSRHGDGWKVRVTAPPEDGKANDAVLDLVAGALAVPRGRVTLVAGHGARDKVVELAGLGADEAERRLG